MNEQFLVNNETEVSKWLNKISNAEKIYDPYHNLLKSIRQYYRNETVKDKQNIFWASVETLKPFLYFKPPRPYVERKEKTSNLIHNMACQIIEKALNWNLEQFDFDSVIKYARNDFLLGGMGIVVERYKPFFGMIDDGEGKQLELKIDEQVNSEYVDPINFIADSEKVGIWEDCTWFAIKHYMTFAEATSLFGQDLQTILFDYSKQYSKSIEIYEIWDKSNSQIMFLSKQCPHHFLKIISKDCDENSFFPMPKPLFATCTNDSIIPVPDYIQIKPMLDELDGITSRMEKTMKALKISGCYDSAFPELGNILNKDVTLVSISDFDRLKSAGGIKNIVDFMPIEQYITALQTLALRRQDIINSIYEITGVSDIMRGTSTKGDTATAVTQKTNFGTLRNQDRQNDMQRFIAEIFKIKAEAICEYFDIDKLLSFLSPTERTMPEAITAVTLLKTDKLRGMVLGVESDITFSDKDSIKHNLDAINTIHNLIAQAFDVVSKQPALLNLYRQMISNITSSLSNARQYENIIANCFDKISAEFNTPDVQPANITNPQILALQLQSQRNEQDYQIKKEQNEIKKAEILLKHHQYQSANTLKENNNAI